MIPSKQLILAGSICLLFIAFVMDSTVAKPMDLFGKGSNEGSSIAPILAAGLVVSLLQHYG